MDELQYTYDDWGNVTKFAMDRNSAISGGTDGSDGYYDVEFDYIKNAPTGGRRTLRARWMTWPDGVNAVYDCLASNNRFDDDVSRVTRITVNSTTLVEYSYTGLGQVVKTNYPQPDVYSQLHGSSMGSYPDLDRFNRVTTSSWTKDLATDVDFYDCDITYDRNSNITLIEDNVHTGFDVEYTNDDLNRLTEAEEGTWGGSSISSRTRDQQWTLDQVGNWDIAKLDLDGDNNWNETDEYNDDRTHNVVNELTARDTDDNGTDDYTLTYDEVGNLIDDGKSSKYVWDAFGRLRKVLDRTDDSLVAEYWYNGLGFMITEHTDTDTDGDVDVNDTKFHYVYDPNWRIVARFDDDSDDPTIEYLPQQAGLDGAGGSSYIDGLVLRQDDTDGNGTLDRRIYYCQNWRSDVVALIGAGGKMKEWVKYTSYGVPMALPAGDTDSDFDCDATDISNIDNWPGGYDVRSDLDLDGDVDSTDSSIASSNYQGVTLGWNVLSNPAIDNVRGYAGYRWKQNTSKYEVRHRVFDPHLGRWTRRDPLGYIDGMSLYEYVGSMPIKSKDPFGLREPDVLGEHAYVEVMGRPCKSCASKCSGAFEDCFGTWPVYVPWGQNVNHGHVGEFTPQRPEPNQKLLGYNVVEVTIDEREKGGNYRQFSDDWHNEFYHFDGANCFKVVSNAPQGRLLTLRWKIDNDVGGAVFDILGVMECIGEEPPFIKSFGPVRLLIGRIHPTVEFEFRLVMEDAHFDRDERFLEVPMEVTARYIHSSERITSRNWLYFRCTTCQMN